MPFDYKKEFKDFYLPPAKPHIVHIPKMQFVAVRGKMKTVIRHPVRKSK